MAVITIYVCTAYPSGGSCPTPSDVMEIQWDTDWETDGTGPSANEALATALENHAVALNSNVDAMDNFFTLEPADVSLISGIMLVTFIVGNSVGKIASLFRKV